jgi:predicted Zn finger-like uncharacterized protein
MTMFRVVPDQLRISKGWVRCGQCEDVFDATSNMQEPLSKNAASIAETPAFESVEFVAPIKPLERPQVEPSYVEYNDGDHRIEPTLEAVRPNKPTTELGLKSFTSTLHTRTSSDETILGESFIEELATGHDCAQAEPVETLNPPSFMRGGSSVSSKRKPWATVSLVFCGLLLSLGLLFQIVLHERDRIAVQAPEIRPWLVALCERVPCTLSPLRQIDSVVIDSSSFNKLRGDVYRLNLTLKNTAQMALAMPAIELSLTDTQDQALMRRVIPAEVLSSKSDSLASDSDFSASLTLSVNTPEGVDRLAGYRILAFYP